MRTMRKSRGRPTGLTLVEVTVVLAMTALFAAIAIPGIWGSIHRAGVDGASQRLTEDIRLAQSSALTRGAQARLIVFDQTGQAITGITDATRANRYRIEMRSSGSAAWPALSDTPGSNPNVLTEWKDIAQDYKGVAVTTGNAIAFNSLGGLTGAATTIVVQGTGGTRTVQINLIGKATIL